MKFKQMEVYFMDNEPEGIRAAWFPTGVFKTFIVPPNSLMMSINQGYIF